MACKFGKVSSKPNSRKGKFPAEDSSIAEALDHAGEASTFIEIPRWLDTLSMDSTAFGTIASQSSPCNSSTGCSATSKSQVLEDCATLLAYATTRLFAHAKLAQDCDISLLTVISRLADPLIWARWVALSELTPGTDLKAYSKSQGLRIDSCFSEPPEVLLESERRIQKIKELSEELSIVQAHVINYRKNQRVGSVASFSSALSHMSRKGDGRPQVLPLPSI